MFPNRNYSMMFTVAVTILACTDDLVERSQMLKQWILIASELLRNHGNLFSFMAIVDGLLQPSVSLEGLRLRTQLKWELR